MGGRWESLPKAGEITLSIHLSATISVHSICDVAPTVNKSGVNVDMRLWWIRWRVRIVGGLSEEVCCVVVVDGGSGEGEEGKGSGCGDGGEEGRRTGEVTLVDKTAGLVDDLRRTKKISRGARVSLSLLLSKLSLLTHRP